MPRKRERDRKKIKVGARLRNCDGDLGHVVGTFDHADLRRYVIASYSKIKRRWFYYVGISLFDSEIDCDVYRWKLEKSDG